MSSTSAPQSAPTRDASDVYDRQIRLWGAEAQSKISSANVLYIHITGVSSEILKNLVLAGVQASICDGRPYPDAMKHTPCSFLSPRKRIEKMNTHNPSEESSTSASPQQKKRKKMTVAQSMQQPVHELNPLLKVPLIEDRPLDDIPDSFFTDFEMIIASRVSLDQAKRISKLAVSSGNKFILVDCFGLKGCAILDLGPKHEYRKEIGKDKLSSAMLTKPYFSFSDILNVALGDISDRWNKRCPKEFIDYRAILQYQLETGHWPNTSSECKEKFSKEIGEWLKLKQDVSIDGEELENLAIVAMSELCPVSAILGGVLGNEVIKALSGKGEPANNLLLFDGMDGGCRNFLVKPK